MKVEPAKIRFKRVAMAEKDEWGKASFFYGLPDQLLRVKWQDKNLEFISVKDGKQSSLATYELQGRYDFAAAPPVSDHESNVFIAFSIPNDIILRFNWRNNTVTKVFESESTDFYWHLHYLKSSGCLVQVAPHKCKVIRLNGSFCDCGPPFFHEKITGYYVSSDVIGDELALNVNGDLVIFSKGGQKRIFTSEPGTGRSAAMAHAGNVWVVREYRFFGEYDRLKLYWKEGSDYRSGYIPLRREDDYHSFNYGDSALIFSERNPDIYIVEARKILRFALPGEIKDSYPYPGWTEGRYYFIDPEGYSVVDVEE
jgi:hypothetical protein